MIRSVKPAELQSSPQGVEERDREDRERGEAFEDSKRDQVGRQALEQDDEKRGEDQRKRDRHPEQDEAEEDREEGDNQRSGPEREEEVEALDEEQQHGGPGNGHSDVDVDHGEAHREGEAGDSEPRVVRPVPQEHEGDDGDERLG